MLGLGGGRYSRRNCGLGGGRGGEGARGRWSAGKRRKESSANEFLVPRTECRQITTGTGSSDSFLFGAGMFARQCPMMKDTRALSSGNVALPPFLVERGAPLGPSTSPQSKGRSHANLPQYSGKWLPTEILGCLVLLDLDIRHWTSATKVHESYPPQRTNRGGHGIARDALKI